MEKIDPTKTNIKIDDEIMKGVPSNAMGISHSKEEFVIDFMMMYPWQNAGIVNARIVLTPGHIKRIVKAFNENIEKYEENNGKIEEAKIPSDMPPIK